MNSSTREIVRQRALKRCEYCRLPDTAAGSYLFHVEHIIAQQHILDDSLENLAYACRECNCFKGPNLTTVDQGTRAIVALFNPRVDTWEEHFEFQGGVIAGRTITGLLTARLLRFNDDNRVLIRQVLKELGELD